MPEPTRIAVVDDHPLFREGVSFTLRSAPDLEVIAEGASGPDAVRIVADHGPDIILLDVSMPGGGIEAAREIRRISPDTRIIAAIRPATAVRVTVDRGRQELLHATSSPTPNSRRHNKCAAVYGPCGWWRDSHRSESISARRRSRRSGETPVV